jgi:FADH2 O2-dependent halogenase
LRTSSGLVFSHFEGLLPLPEAVDAPLPGRTPFPERHAAVHHLLDEGWIYELRFDHGVTSAGLLVAGGLPPGAGAATLWSRVVGRYPTVARQLAPAQLLRPLAAIPTIQRRLDRTAGASWAALPHTAGFVDPLFSTGIAWSLLAVERLADVLAVHPPGSAAVRDGSAFRRYAALLAAELEQVDRLVAGAYAARRELELFVGQTMLYFTLVSFAEAGQRLLDADGACWSGLLRADRAGWRRVFSEALTRVQTAAERPAPDVLAAHAAWIAEVTAEVNIAGLCRPGERLYDIDFEALVAAAPRLGLSAAEVRTALPRLRGAAVS